MKPLFLILLLSGCKVQTSGPAWGHYTRAFCSPDGVYYWVSGGKSESLTPRLDKDGKVIPCQP